MNMFEVQEDFGLEFGAHGKRNITFPAVKTVFKFTTPMHTEDDVRFGNKALDIGLGQSNLLQLYDDEGTLMFTSTWSLPMFVAAEDVDPFGTPLRVGTGIWALTGERRPRRIWLEGGRTYTLVVTPPNGIEHPDKELTIWYTGTDGNEKDLVSEPPEPAAPDATVHTKLDTIIDLLTSGTE